MFEILVGIRRSEKLEEFHNHMKAALLKMDSPVQNSSVDKSVLILSKSPYKDQNPKIGPYLVLVSAI